jgi:hypothetical protein
LPCYPGLSADAVDYICDVVDHFEADAEIPVPRN